MKIICIIGSGQLGSRHLQALKTIGTKLNIFIVDPSNESLDIAKERYDTIDPKNIHELLYLNNIESLIF